MVQHYCHGATIGSLLELVITFEIYKNTIEKDKKILNRQMYKWT